MDTPSAAEEEAAAAEPAAAAEEEAQAEAAPEPEPRAPPQQEEEACAAPPPAPACVDAAATAIALAGLSAAAPATPSPPKAKAAPEAMPTPPLSHATAHAAAPVAAPSGMLLRDPLADSCLLDKTAAPPPAPSDYPYMVRGASQRAVRARKGAHRQRLALALGCSCGPDVTAGGFAPLTRSCAFCFPLSLSSCAPPPLSLCRQTALLDVVRQSHVIAGAAVGVAAGLVFSLRALRRS
jgi:hypothetical protein